MADKYGGHAKDYLPGEKYGPESLNYSRAEFRQAGLGRSKAAAGSRGTNTSANNGSETNSNPRDTARRAEAQRQAKEDTPPETLNRAKSDTLGKDGFLKGGTLRGQQVGAAIADDNRRAAQNIDLELDEDTKAQSTRPARGQRTPRQQTNTLGALLGKSNSAKTNSTVASLETELNDRKMAMARGGTPLQGQADNIKGYNAAKEKLAAAQAKAAEKQAKAQQAQEKARQKEREKAQRFTEKQLAAEAKANAKNAISRQRVKDYLREMSKPENQPANRPAGMSAAAAREAAWGKVTSATKPPAQPAARPPHRRGRNVKVNPHLGAIWQKEVLPSLDAATATAKSIMGKPHSKNYLNHRSAMYGLEIPEAYRNTPAAELVRNAGRVYSRIVDMVPGVMVSAGKNDIRMANQGASNRARTLSAYGRGTIDLLSDSAIGIHGLAAKESAKIMGKEIAPWGIDAIVEGLKFAKDQGLDALRDEKDTKRPDDPKRK